MTNPKTDPQPEAVEILETLEPEALEAVTGGAWPAWAYKVGDFVSRQDPSMIAAGFLM